MSTSPQRSNSPKLLWAFTEIPRLSLDVTALRLGRKLLKSSPPGDGHGVIVMPGFLGSDSYSKPLRRFLTRLGYRAFGWNQGRNMGPSTATIEGLEQELVRIAELTGGKVSIIGHSLGGVYAREIAKRAPEIVRQVITLGSPFGEGRETGSPTAKLFRYLNPPTPESEALRHQLAEAPPVPYTSVFTKADGVVHWHQSIQHEGHEKVQNVRVRGSHIGMTANLSVWTLLADRLAIPDGEWHPFRPKKPAKILFPRRVKNYDY